MDRRSLALALFATLVAAPIAGTAYGHGLGEDRAPPVAVGDGQITVTGRINPFAVPFDSSAKPTLLIRALEQNSNATIAGVDYNIVAKLRNETMLEQRFKSVDGIISANLIPDKDALSATITGHESVDPSQQIEVSQAAPVEIRSKILATGGLYHFEVTLEKTSQGIALERDLKFDLYISVSYAQNFPVSTEDGEKNVVVKTYYDNVSELSYQNGTILFSMPFDWDPDYVSQVPLIHMEVQFPRSIEALQSNSYLGSLNGAELQTAHLQIDDYASEENRIVHFVVPNDHLEQIAQELDSEADAAVFNLTATDRPRFPVDLLSAPLERYLVQLSWGPEVIRTGIPTTFVINVRDPVTEDVLRNPSFDFVMVQNGSEIYRERLQSNLGTFSKDYTFSQPGTVTFSAANINGNGESVRLDLVVLQGPSNPPQQKPPEQSQSGCLIATAAFGSELSPQVQYLRNFRENYILSTASGSAFMATFNSIYYSFSPQVADYERQQPWMQSVVRVGLYPLFGILNLSERAHFGVGGGEAGAIFAGVTASSLIGAVYLLPAGMALTRRVETRWIVLAMGAAVAFLVITILLLPSLLPFSTAGLVVVLAGSVALLAAKPVLRLFRRR